MEGIAECDGMPVCVVLTKQYWWAETPPFDMISPPSSADSELPPQNIHRILSPICSVSAINVVHLCHVHARAQMAREVALQRDPHAHAQYWCNYSYSPEKLRTVEPINVVMQLHFIMYNMIIFNYTTCKKKKCY